MIEGAMRLTLPVAAALMLCACGRATTPTPTPTPSVAPAQVQSPAALAAITRAAAARLDASAPPLSAMAQLGRKMFFDASLSGSGRMSCATCHNPANAYAPANALAVQLGGPDLNQPGARAVPSLTYLERTPKFVIRPDGKFDPDDGGVAKAARPVFSLLPDGKTGPANGPNSAKLAQLVPEGGMDWDGRAATLPEQAGGPLFDPREMANRDGAALLARLKATPYANEFIAVFGQEALRSPDAGLADVYLALTRFQVEDRSFHTYDSKFDYYLAGRAQLSERELRGLKLFDDLKKGGCAACHLDRPTKNRMAPAFTDYEFEALAPPRNRDLVANRNPAFFDEGLCGPARNDMAGQQQYCGLFKTPTLRNVATRQVFFHNGAIHTLEDAVRFYVERETRPGKWYPRQADGTVEMYDDLPAAHRVNVDVGDAPFNRHRGDEPALNDREIEDVVAFLKTLTDGYRQVN